jgi:predicted nucleic acid-binding protein
VSQEQALPRRRSQSDHQRSAHHREWFRLQQGLEQEEQVLQALEAYAKGLDFADALHLLRSEGCAALVSFDRAFVRKAGELALTPAVQQL